MNAEDQRQGFEIWDLPGVLPQPGPEPHVERHESEPQLHGVEDEIRVNPHSGEVRVRDTSRLSSYEYECLLREVRQREESHLEAERHRRVTLPKWTDKVADVVARVLPAIVVIFAVIAFATLVVDVLLGESLRDGLGRLQLIVR
jgi:hypothetical protein